MDSDRIPEYEQFLLFGDSITQFSNDQSLGFGFGAALQNGQYLYLLVNIPFTAVIRFISRLNRRVLYLRNANFFRSLCSTPGCDQQGLQVGVGTPV